MVNVVPKRFVLTTNDAEPSRLTAADHLYGFSTQA
jgi:hypothetical protein